MINVVLDLSDELGKIRDQGCRPTCLAFAASDVHAYISGLKKNHLSPEYAFYYAAQRQQPTNYYDGVRTDVLFDAIHQDGQPLESHFPYQEGLAANDPLPIPLNPFPHTIHTQKISPDSSNRIDDIIACLNRNETPILAVRITRAFHSLTKPNAIINDTVGDHEVGLHALVAVGYGKNTQDMIHIKIRNSWGAGWANDGHAWLSSSYLNRHMTWFATTK